MKNLYSIMIAIVAFVVFIGVADAKSKWYNHNNKTKRFKVINDGTEVIDKETGLVWEREPGTGERGFDKSKTYCFEREVDGRKVMRAPTVTELASLIDKDESDPALPPGIPIDLGDITCSGCSRFWTTTPEAGEVDKGLTVIFGTPSSGDGNGEVRPDDIGDPHRTMCVRSKPESLK